ncbi:DUF1194 domain-containing protein [Silicimonas algicola]|uniref:Uncharacterized protein DUF1194 n=1 Tax=Silicimonas algicola TaxID=1826607 RepID=A0A316G7C2_9RHOB|nr:DUF1194 domain-containing protein [Silicimonas algicola]AZQ68599.1 DUF1194 domain-containing protein [Silicimonas algicola]PWK55680.1 uncharacterized protein DUF1194 [Silicimonas algicola]
MRWRLGLILCLAALPLWAQAVEVDVELSLMVDVSRSMGPEELEIQRRGYAAAIASDEVVKVIENSYTGRIAITYVEWAGRYLQRVVVPWTVIDGREAAEAVARQLTADFDFSMRRTSISGAIEYAHFDIETNDFEGLRRVIDLSGDGPNNDGVPVTEARDAAVGAGIVINGLPLMTEDSTSRWGIDDLDVYYQTCVIGGPGAFVIPVLEWGDFPMAVRRKLVLELAGPPEVVLAARTGRTPDGYDCLVGEKLRRERDRIWGEP